MTLHIDTDELLIGGGNIFISTKLKFSDTSHQQCTTLCPTLRLDVMSLSEDYVLQVSNHKNECICRDSRSFMLIHLKYMFYWKWHHPGDIMSNLKAGQNAVNTELSSLLALPSSGLWQYSWNSSLVVILTSSISIHEMSKLGSES